MCPRSNQTPGDFSSSPILSKTSNTANNEVLGNYIVKDVKRGGMGEVYICATQEAPDYPIIALKSFQKHLFLNAATRRSFTREAKIWLLLSGSPFIMPIVSLTEIKGRPFISMMAINPDRNGVVTLRDWIENCDYHAGDVLDIALQIAIGMRDASAKIPDLVHGDLKPENILLLNEGVLISDFGLARAINKNDDSLILEGTWAYLAPECWDSMDNFQTSADIYAFGVILYELIKKKPLFNENSREGWANAHKNQPVYAHYDESEICLTDEDIYRRLTLTLMTLAHKCVQKDSLKRFGTFGEIVYLLVETAQIRLSTDYFDQLMEKYARSKYFLENASNVLFEQRIFGLLKLNENASALAEFENLPNDSLSGPLLSLKGTVLSLNNRDEEALSCFDRALGLDISDEQKWKTLSEYGLSLKRLKRFDEAVGLYYKILPEIPEHLVPMIISNLATVYLEKKEPERAIEAIVSVKNRHQIEQPTLWTILGQAYQADGQYDNAARAFQKAVAVSPTFVQAQFLYACVCMDHLFLIEEAATALDTMFDQGFISYEWLIRMLACNIILQRMDVVMALLDIPDDPNPAEASKTLPEESLKHFKEATELSIKILDDYNRKKQQEPERPAKDDPPLTEKIRFATTTGKFGNLVSRGVRAIKSIFDRNKTQTLNLSSPNDHVLGSLPPADQEFSFPFLNTRFYVSENKFSIDFYNDPNTADYVDEFDRCWKQVSRDPQFNNSEMLTNALYFTECPQCSLNILTNRDKGKNLRCRKCNSIHQCVPISNPLLDQLTFAVMQRVGQEIADISGQIQLLLVQPENPADLKKVKEICLGRSFREFQKDHPAVFLLFSQAVSGLLFDAGKPFSAWQKEAPAGERHVSGETSLEVESLVRILRLETNSLRTTSTTYDPDNMLFSQNYDEMIKLFETQIQADPESIEVLLALIYTLKNKGDVSEARKKAQIATKIAPDSDAVWLALGTMERDLKNHQGAIEAFEKVLQLNPVSTAAMFYLGDIYKALGKDRQAAEMFERFRSMGGYH